MPRTSEDGNINRHFGQVLKTLRAAKGMSQEGLGKVMGLSFQQVQKYETGANKISAYRLYRLCQIFGVGPDHFFEGIEDYQGEHPDRSLERLRITRMAGQLNRLNGETRDSLRSLIGALANE